MIRGIYTGILLLHLPYIFFTLKEYTLVMYEELTSRTLSMHLQSKLEQESINHQFYQEDTKQQEEDEKENLLNAASSNNNNNEEDLNGQDQAQEDEVQSQAESVKTDKSELTYKNLPALTQNIVTLSLHLTILVTAFVVKDIATIFDIVGTIAAASVIFIFPAVGYLTALSRFGKQSDSSW